MRKAKGYGGLFEGKSNCIAQKKAYTGNGRFYEKKLIYEKMELLATGTAGQLIAGVGTNVQTLFGSVQDVVFVVIALGLTFWLAKQLVGMFPKAGARR